MCINESETLHFMQDNDENIICIETGEVFRREDFIVIGEDDE